MPVEAPPTPDLILDAAERLFARKGFAATTIKQIATDARVNSALLYYYYDSKETLYRAMLQRILSQLLARGTDAVERATSHTDRIRAFIRAQTKLLAEHPHFPQLLVREMVDHQAAHAEQAITSTAAGAFKRLCDVIVAGQKDGVFRPALDPRFAAISIIAQVAYFAIARPAVGILLGHGTAGPPPELAERYFAHAEDFALSALLALPESGRAS
ncbi:MAG TPA: CerR family C-terminal domain-containing protein [Gemmatimonadaceae bacterium]|nr:CerR family C-terminal domain-containing protein [Gemmatimonadaceae bacterium]